MKKKTKTKGVSDLRKGAEKQIALTGNDLEAPPALISPESMATLVHELQVHQIELEMQNEELRRTQEELESSRSRYRHLYDLAPVGYCTLNEKGVILEANLTAASLLSVERGALINQPLTRVIFPEDQDIYYGFHHQLYKTGLRQVCEIRMLQKEAAPFWVRLEATLVKNIDGAPLCLLTVSDITQHKKAEDELRRRSEELETILDILPVMVWVGLDPECRVITANRAAHEMTQTPAGTNMSRSAVPLGQTAYIKQVKADGCEYPMEELPMRRAAALGKPVRNAEIGFCFPDGRQVDTFGHAAPLFDRNGQVRGVVAAFADITEKKKNEKRLQKAHDELEDRVRERTLSLILSNEHLLLEISEREEAEAHLIKNKEMLQAVFDGISDPLVMLDTDMRVKVLNKSAMEYYALAEPQGVIGEFCYKAFKGESRLCKGCRIFLTILKAGTLHFERQGFMDPLREEKVYLYSLPPKNGQKPEIIYRINDITERKVFEKRLIQNEKMASLGILVSSIAHEINNPNAFISFNIPILKEYVDQLMGIIDTYSTEHPDLELFYMSYPVFREDIFRLVDNIAHGSERIDAFVSNLKEFSRIKNKSKERGVDLTAVAEKAIAICRIKVKKTVKSFMNDIPENFPQIHTDPIALEQILINLLINAAQAADKEDSWTRLSAKTGRTWLDHVIIEVKDNGCGINEKNIDHIFDPFFSTKIPSEGTGLGLYVCHDLATGLGGRIEVETRVGEFSTFRVILPDMDRRKEKRL